jgi:hypothetical protein
MSLGGRKFGPAKSAVIRFASSMLTLAGRFGTDWQAPRLPIAMTANAWRMAIPRRRG